MLLNKLSNRCNYSCNLNIAANWLGLSEPANDFYYTISLISILSLIMVLIDKNQLISSGGKYTNMINIKHEN